MYATAAADIAIQIHRARSYYEKESVESVAALAYNIIIRKKHSYKHGDNEL